MKVTIVEGTPEEIAAAFPNLGGASTTTVVLKEAEASSVGSERERRIDSEIKYPTVQFARAVLKRRRLAPEQKKVLSTLYDAGERLVSGAELQRVLDYRRPQFSGLMGAFGRRVGNTPGYDGEWFFVQEWDFENGCYLYSLPEAVREALRQENLV